MVVAQIAAITHRLTLGDEVVDAERVPVETLGARSDHSPQLAHVLLQQHRLHTDTMRVGVGGNSERSGQGYTISLHKF